MAHAHAGVDTKFMGIGPVPASCIAREPVKLTIDRRELIEAKEAFAARACTVMNERQVAP